MTSVEDIVESLDQEYDRDSGFIGLLRVGVFSREAADRFISTLALIGPQQGALDLRIVRHVWFALAILAWQRPRLDPLDVPRLESVINSMVNLFEKNLGVP